MGLVFILPSIILQKSFSKRFPEVLLSMRYFYINFILSAQDILIAKLDFLLSCFRYPFSADQPVTEPDWEVYLRETAMMIVQQQSPKRYVYIEGLNAALAPLGLLIVKNLTDVQCYCGLRHKLLSGIPRTSDFGHCWNCFIALKILKTVK